MINVREQLAIIPKVKQLCIEQKYDEAIKEADKILIPNIHTKAILLCYEHELAVKKGKE